MAPLEPTQDLLLNYLYGLLDDAEQRQVEAKVNSSPEWQAALAKVREQQQLLAEASRTQFSEVRFNPPSRSAERRASERKARKAQPQSSGRRWALAAAILLAVTGLLGYSGISWYSHYSAHAQARHNYEDLLQQQRQQQRDRAAEEERLRQEMRAIQEQIKLIETSWQQKRDQTIKQLNDDQLQVVVTGPRTLQAGARNEFQIQTRRGDLGGQIRGAAPAKVVARVVEPQSRKVLFEKELDSPNGQARVELPRDLPVKPHTQLNLEVEAVDAAGRKARASEALPLIGTLYVTHLTTDRPMYRPGETVHFRSLTLERFNLRPPSENFHITYTITNPRNEPIYNKSGTTHLIAKENEKGLLVKGPDGRPIEGIGAAEFKIPADAPGGVYTLTVRDQNGKFPEENRKFLVNRYQAPRLNKDVEFTRKSYGPGDVVEALCKVARAEGGKPMAHKPVRATVNVDGQQVRVDRPELRTDELGTALVRFTLPKNIERGAASLSVEFQDGTDTPNGFKVSVTETTVRPIPVVVRKLFVEFFPEGGDLIAGVPNRVYFRVRTPLGKPAEVQGQLLENGKAISVVDHFGKKGTSITTLSDDVELGVNQGLGAFTFIPQADQKYELKIDTPIGIENQPALPAARNSGVTLHIPQGIVKDTITAVVNSTQERKLLVGAYCRGRLLDHTIIAVKPGAPTKVALKPAEGVGGVYRVTVFEEKNTATSMQMVPVAERLLYRQPSEKLDFNITANRDSYSPGERVELKLKAMNEAEKPAPAIVLVSVVDRSIIKLADEKTARSLPTHFFLTTEVQKAEDLEHADFLVSAHPKAGLALDLLLGTQGWRRFAEQDPQLFRQKEQRNDALAAERLLQANGLAVPQQRNLAETALQKVEKDFAPKWAQKQEALAQVERREDTARTQAVTDARVMANRISSAATAHSIAQEELRQHGWFLVQLGFGVVATVLLILGATGVVIGMLRMSHGEEHHAPYLVGGLCCLLFLFVGSAVGILTLLGDRDRTFQNVGVAMATKKAEVMVEDKVAAVPEAAEGAANDFQRVEEKQAVDLEAPKMAMPPPAPALPALAPQPGVQPVVPPALEPPVVPVAPVVKNQGVQVGAVPPGPVPAVEPQAPAVPPLALADGAVPAGIPKQGQGGQIVPGANKMPVANGPAFRMPANRPAPGFGGGFAGGGGFAPGFPGQPFGGPVAPGGMMPPGAGFGGNGLFPEQARELRRLNDLQRLAQLRFGRPVEELPERVPFVVREYAHVHQTQNDGVRRDFSETLYWHPALVLTGGTGQVSFQLPDSVTTFDVVVWGHGLNGRLGAGTTGVVSKLPFSVEPKVPIEVTSNDKVIVPVSVANRTNAERSVELEVNGRGLTFLGDTSKTLVLGPESSARQLVRFQPSINLGEALLRATGRSAPFGNDSVERTFKVVPEGFPVVQAKSDLLEGDARHSITLPESWVKGSLKVQVQVFPSTLADLQKGLEALLREPCGCFEQSSTSNYPNVLILNYLQESEQSKPEVEARARQLLTSGYARLTGFECIAPSEQNKKRGYEWFGGTAPAHEALTAYGLLQFKDMAKVYKVDEAMLKRTLEYLLQQRDGQGGFKRNPRALDSFGGAPLHITNAYIVWALTEAGVPENLDKEFDALLKQAKTSKDTYFLSLVGNALLNVSRSKDALPILKKVASQQQEDGRITGAETSITRSGGRDLEIETTALALLGWLKANQPGEFNTSVQKAAKWIGQQRGGYGGFGSTQSTILALKGLINHARANKRTSEAGELKLYVNGSKEPVAVKAFAAGSQEELIVAVPKEDLLAPGKNDLRVEISGKNSFPYTLSVTYNTLQPASAEKAPVHLTAKLDRTEAKEGESVRLTAQVENKSGKGQGMTMAIIGLPGGLSVPEDMKQLKEMMRLRDNDTKPGEISFFEIRGRELILYWRDLGPTQTISVNIDLICRLPGEYRGPASRAYLYYNADHKHWVEPLTIAIAPQE